jgi:hypothetical protein
MSFQGLSRQTALLAFMFGVVFLAGDVIPITAATLGRMDRFVAPALVVRDQISQRARRLRSFPARVLPGALARRLDGIPNRLSDDGLMLSGMDLALVTDLAAVERVRPR